MQKQTVKEIKSWIITIITSLILVLTLNMFILKTAKVEGNSMYPTLHDKDFGITWVLPTKFNSINRFDIVVVDKKEQGNWIKRVVGLPNETVEYRFGELYVNGNKVEETFLEEKFLGDFNKITLKEDEYFVMGDNRNYSTDSRIVGPIHKTEIVSKGFLVILPLNQFGVK